jgi:two-component system, NarL family, nitrate/nitrite response regulator NarL
MGRKASGDAIRGIRTRVGAEVVALAVTETEEEILDYARAGASGYVARGASLNELVSTVESVSRGEILCSPRIAAALFKRAGALANDSRAPLHRLTRRETEIVGLVARGLSNKQIAQRLFIEVATVKNHLHNIFEKLQVRSRIEAVMVYQASSRTPR